MNFVRPLIAKHLNLPEEKIKIDDDNPSFTVSRGIALLGATDAITSVLVSELKSQLPSLINNDVMLSNLTIQLASNITNVAWRVVDNSCSEWIKHGNTTDENELKRWVENNLRDFQINRVSIVVNETLQNYIRNSTEEISAYSGGYPFSISGDIRSLPS